MSGAKRFVLAGLAAAYGWAGAGLEGPVTGYVFDARQGMIRAIEGLPGGARLGTGLAVGERLRGCAVESVGRRAVCGTEAGGWLWVDWAGGTVRTRELAGLAGAAERAAWSADGAWAVVHLEPAGEGGRRLRWVREGEVTGMVETGPGWRLLAAGPDGGWALVTNGPELWRVDTEGVWEWVARGMEIGAAAVAEDGGVYYADRGAKEMWKVASGGPGASAVRVLREADGVDGPVALGACRTDEGEQVVLVDGAGARLAIVRAGGRGTETVGLWARPSGMAPLHREGWYLLNEPGRGPLLLLNCAGRAVSFVPVD
ncbi:MAG: hypothetical protein ACK55F_06675 [Acidobacteriota bacterium]